MKKILFLLLLVLISFGVNAQTKHRKKKLIGLFREKKVCPTYAGSASSTQNRKYFSKHYYYKPQKRRK